MPIRPIIIIIIMKAALINFNVIGSFDSAQIQIRWFRFSVAGTPAEYERDIKQVTSVLIILRN